MCVHYNAFISYRHAPLDTKVASEVQRQLERFRIPKSIRKATGIQRIDRIFRDKEELTITSDLNETIESALNNSDFLIVICSKSTKESIWVLRQRQRQYRARRFAVAAAAVLLGMTGLAAYYAWSAIRIQENYEQSLKNQSEYLSSESQKLLEGGDRLSAMYLSSEALPNAENERPVVASAVNALAEATYAYVAPGKDELTLHSAFSHSGEVEDYFTNEDQTRLYVHHGVFHVTVWDVESHTQLFTFTSEETISDFLLTSEGNLLIISDTVSCYDAQTWDLLWRRDDTHYTSAYAVAVPGVSRLVLGAWETGHLVDSLTGQTIQSITLPETSDGDTISFREMEISADGRYVASPVSVGSMEGNQTAIWDLQANTVALNEEKFYYCYDIHVLEDGSTVLVGDDDVLQSDISMLYGMNGVDYHLYYTTSFPVVCTAPDGTTLWTSEVSFSQMYNGLDLHSIAYTTPEGEAIPAVVCVVGDIAQVMDRATGETLLRVQFPGVTIASRAEDSRIRAVLDTGFLATYGFAEEMIVATDSFISDLGEATIGYDYFVCANGSDRILLYRWDIYDENWVSLTGKDQYFSSISTFLPVEEGLLLLTGDSEMRYYDAASEKMLWEQQMSQEDYNYTLVGLDNTGTKAVVVEKVRLEEGGSYSQLLQFDLATGEYVAMKLDCDVIGAVPYALDGWYYYPYIDEMVRVNPATGEQERIAVGCEGPYFRVSSDGSKFLLWNWDGATFLYADGETHAFPGAYNYNAIEWYNDGEMIALSSAKSIEIYDRSLNLVTEIPTDGRSVETIRFYNGELLAVFAGEGLYRYDPLTGEQLGSLEFACDVYSGWTAKWDFMENGLLALRLEEALYESHLYLIDTNSWHMHTAVSDCLGYCPKSEKLFVFGYTDDDDYECQLGIFRLYSHEELIQRANELLGNFDLTPEQKSAYGLD